MSQTKIATYQLSKGLLYRRQGNTTGANSWYTPGTSNTDTSGTDIIVQAGSLAANANPTTLTFPVGYNQVPLVIVTTNSSNTTNGFAQITATTTTTATVRVIAYTGGTASVITTESVAWVAYGQ